jgi:large subunit ribosomal protein L9
MSKTEVILTHNIVGLGGESDHVKVAAGYARNYLFPQGFAIPLTGANKRRIEALKQRRAVREADELNHMTELSHSLAKLIAVITVKTGEDGKMFGSVTAGTIADQLKTQFDIGLDKRKIHLEHPIRALGEHEVELRLHADVVTKLKVKIESSTPLAKPAETAEPAAAEKKEHPRTEKRGKHFAERATAQAEAPSEKPEHPERKPRAPKASKAPKADKE